MSTEALVGLVILFVGIVGCGGALLLASFAGCPAGCPECEAHERDRG